MQLAELCPLLSASPTAREARLARRRVRDRALRAAQSTAQREALQRRKPRDDTVVGGQRRGKFGKLSPSGRVTGKLSTCITAIDDSCKTSSTYTGHVVNGRIARAAS